MRFEYTHAHAGREFTGSRYAFRHPSLYMDDAALFALQEGLSASCFVNPDDPRQAVLERDLPLGAYGHGGLLVGLFGILLLAWSLAFGRPVSSGWARAFGKQAPTWLTRGSAVLMGFWAVRVLVMKWLNLLGASLLLISGALALGLWFDDARVLRRVAAWLLLVAVLLSLCGLNPLALTDIETDEIHDPGYVVNYVLAWLSHGVMLASIAYMAAVRARLLAESAR